MSKTEKISERLPHFYKHWQHSSYIYGLISAIGKHLDESEKELVSIMQAHWVDRATGDDLEKLGALYSIKRKENENDSEYRNNLKTAIISYKGGGTINAIENLVRITLRLPEDYPVKIVENPIKNMKRTWKRSAGQKWKIDPENIQDTVPDITIEVKTDNARVIDPTITNLTTKESITFKGDVYQGDILKISKGKAFLNDKDQTDRLSTTNIPVLPRKKTTWEYTEFVGANQGAFDGMNFDKSFFSIEIISSVTFEWTASQPATFELHLSKDNLNKAGFDASYMQDLINSVKASGIKAEVKVI